jgi:tetratricopeptide (TPR) repeat protein
VEGEDQEALAAVRRCQHVASRLADPWVRTEALQPVAGALVTLQKPEQADVLYRELLAIKRELGDELRVAHLLNNVGYTAMIRGGYDEARASLEESVAITRRLRDLSGVTLALGNLGLIALFEGRFGDALALLREDLDICNSRGDRRCGAEAILGLAATHAALGNLELAGKLDAIRQALEFATGVVHPTVLLDRLEPHLGKARQQADPAIVESFVARQGRTLTMETAITELERNG